MRNTNANTCKKVSTVNTEHETLFKQQHDTSSNQQQKVNTNNVNTKNMKHKRTTTTTTTLSQLRANYEPTAKRLTKALSHECKLSQSERQRNDKYERVNLD